MPAKKSWKTQISGEVNNEIVIRGYKLTDLIGNVNFTQAIFLILQGRLLTSKEEKIFNTILVAPLDHGLGAPSTTVARTVQSCGNSLNTSVAAGLLAQGDFHGGAIDKSMEMLKKAVDENKKPDDVVADALTTKKILHGFGHKVYKDYDPRTKAIVDTLKKQKAVGKHVTFALEMEQEIEKQKGTKIVLNIDGIIAAVALDLGFSPALGKGLFMIPRVAGLVAHAVEEQQEKPFRRLSPEEYEYIGTTGKKL